MHFPSSWRNATREKVAAITEIVTYAIFPPLVSDRASFYLSNPDQSTAVSTLTLCVRGWNVKGGRRGWRRRIVRFFAQSGIILVRDPCSV